MASPNPMTSFEAPKAGDPIRMQGDKLAVPGRPIVPFIEGDGPGPDIWRASRAMLDAAVKKAYGGKRQNGWEEGDAGEGSASSGCCSHGAGLRSARMGCRLLDIGEATGRQGKDGADGDGERRYPRGSLQGTANTGVTRAPPRRSGTRASRSPEPGSAGDRTVCAMEPTVRSLTSPTWSR